MSTCVSASPCRSSLSALNSPQSQQKPHRPFVLPIGVNNTLARSLKLAAHAPIYGRYESLSKHMQAVHLLKYQKQGPVCLLGGKDKSEGGKEGFPWSLDKLMKNLKGKSVEDVLQQQIEKGEYYDGGRGNSPPRWGGGGDRGGGFGEPEDEGLSGILDETLQVTLAIIGFILLYLYIIYGKELTLLAKDYLRYVLKGSQSVRLKKVMDKWKRLFRKLNEPKLEDKFWLEKAIINTPTLYDSPEKTRRIVSSMLASSESEE